MKHWPEGWDVEWVRIWKNGLRIWLTQAGRIAAVMARGTYWVGERKRLLTALGVATQKQLKDADALERQSVQSLLDQIARLEDVIRQEETSIQEIRGANTSATRGKPA